MKKYIFIVLLLGFMPFIAKAEVPANTFFLGDGKGYDTNGVQTYFCLADNNCYDISGVFGFIKEAQTTIVDLQNKVSDLQTKVTNLQNNQTSIVNDLAGGGVTVPVDTTPPVFTQSYAYACFTHNCDNPFKGIMLTTNEPTTIQYSFYPLGANTNFEQAEQNISTPIIYSDNVLATDHKLKYSDIPLSQDTFYYLDIKATDSNGNTVDTGFLNQQNIGVQW